MFSKDHNIVDIFVRVQDSKIVSNAIKNSHILVFIETNIILESD